MYLAESDLHKIIYEKTRINPHEESQRNISHRSYSKPTSYDSKQRQEKSEVVFRHLRNPFFKFRTKNSQFLSQKFLKTF